MSEFSVFWFRRDLRLDDNAGLFHALTSGRPVIPLFIFDKEILDDLPAQDARVDFIHRTLEDLQEKLQENGSSLLVKYGYPLQVWEEILSENKGIKAVYTNHDYEPYALQRDREVGEILQQKGISFHTFKDQVIFEKEEILSGKGSPYTVFTPYSKNWKASLTQAHLADYGTEAHFSHFFASEKREISSLESMGFERTNTLFPKRIPEKEIIKVYDQKRDFPAQKGVTRVGMHLRFGTMSIRKLVRVAIALNETYLNELIWREFYMQILANFPYVVNGPFKPAYAAIKWRNDPEEFEKWKAGKTGFPLVDAGMREIAATGYMHNRVRMVVSSFLVKHLLINWQWGEAYFAEKLLDFELASNNGGWQWAAGCGTDAAPYFRIFNPESQLKKFDAQAAYVRKWVPEYGTPAYPQPMVDHKMARERCLDTFKLALSESR